MWDGEVRARDWKWWKRISGPVEGESGLPAAEKQLVSRPASPAPSVSHLLHLLGAPLHFSVALRDYVIPCGPAALDQRRRTHAKQHGNENVTGFDILIGNKQDGVEVT